MSKNNLNFGGPKESFDQIIKENLSDVIEMFDLDLHKQINWEKEVEYLSDELIQLMIDKGMERNSSDIIISPKLYNSSNILSFLVIRVIFDEQKGPALAFTPLIPWTLFEEKILNISDQEIYEESEEELSDEEILKEMKKFAEKIKNGEMIKPEDTSRCSSCGRNDLPLSIVVNASLNRSDYLCSVCLSKSQNSEEDEENDLEELEKMISQYEGMLKQYEDLIETAEMPEVPKGLERIALTPLSIYKSLQAVVADMKSRRMELLSKMETPKKLEIQLERSILDENYEESAKILDKLHKEKKKKS